ncbi:hypothetical protein PF010_g11508 [Phytophthora fragariae]|uniref:Uncharacterized protein n=1 Tax=Phytophthora fragariae TaxID=53985 RepID=A0A6A3WWN5_9STRA|nr:hypothetical protein PF003_g38244 [Phytophthora fragariae]KAE8943753.1 hypothetical protein PF009_g6526 [Phytophthora fragariae]KAE9007635.1 hypothetical protein PF011_g11038 [Phytophthora fragariae]KAE9105987.1 hypothetical protein PF006_g21474 [Phytophthora fragariae]KAE9109548.1 hypothetical protein PF010_g11508 [Phytophthora fragariae]
MAASPADSLAAGMLSPASVYSRSPSATAARVAAASPPVSPPATTDLSTPPLVAVWPTAQADFERAPSAALAPDTADPAGEASYGDSQRRRGACVGRIEAL